MEAAVPEIAGFRDIRPLASADDSFFGDLFEAFETRANRQVVIKALKSGFGPRERERFAKEWELLGRLRQEGGRDILLPVLYRVTDAKDGRLCAVIERMGRSLQSRVDNSKPLASVEAARLFRGVATTLDEIHRVGIVHRDVRPPNLLHGKDEAFLVLSDFGIAADLNDYEYQDAAPSVIGIPAFSAPELLGDGKGAPSAATDLWSLSVTLWFGLTGRRAFPLSRRQLEAAATAGKLHPPEPAPAGFAEFFGRAFATDPGDRFPDGEAWATGLDVAAEQAAWAGDDDAAAYATRITGVSREETRAALAVSMSSREGLRRARAEVLAAFSIAGEEQPVMSSTPHVPSPDEFEDLIGNVHTRVRDARWPTGLSVEWVRAVSQGVMQLEVMNDKGVTTTWLVQCDRIGTASRRPLEGGPKDEGVWQAVTETSLGAHDRTTRISSLPTGTQVTAIQYAFGDVVGVLIPTRPQTLSGIEHQVDVGESRPAAVTRMTVAATARP